MRMTDTYGREYTFTACVRVERYDALTESWRNIGSYYEMFDAKTVADIERKNNPETLIRIIRTIDY